MLAGWLLGLSACSAVQCAGWLAPARPFLRGCLGVCTCVLCPLVTLRSLMPLLLAGRVDSLDSCVLACVYQRWLLVPSRSARVSCAVQCGPTPIAALLTRPFFRSFTPSAFDPTHRDSTRAARVV